MACVELDLRELEEGTELFKALRLIDQDLVDSCFHFNINSRVHGQSLFTQDLHFSLNGRKLVKSLSSRVNGLKDALFKQPENERFQKLKLMQSKGLLPQKDSVVCKIINISKSIGTQVRFPALNKLAEFPCAFGRLVEQRGTIDKLFFCFDLSLFKKQSDFSPLPYISPPKTDLVELGSSPKYDLLQEFRLLKEDKAEEPGT